MTEDFGWYLSLKELAESGIFTRDGMSAMESAERADLYEALQYLAASRAQNRFFKRYQEVND